MQVLSVLLNYLSIQILYPDNETGAWYSQIMAEDNFRQEMVTTIFSLIFTSNFPSLAVLRLRIALMLIWIRFFI
jgi:hypothetical protein